MVRLVKTTPVIQASDMDAALQSLATVGFRALEKVGDPLQFAILGRDGVEIFVTCVPRLLPTRLEWVAYVHTDHVDELYAEAKAAGAALRGPLQDKVYGCREFEIEIKGAGIVAFGQILKQ